ncbi:M28 family metallopeptidase [Desulfoscipio geothermicus]|uniref:Peptidase family M28 n=1 Tax=Desulfoscipio geothermicus DSM 3669 TaxID=1121426 RepID=A0A1I6EM84_9FIRM|nr:M28 family peptidase [Desulfoscipio geothermicus]SFR18747.1 Peptidase family M28 [Desulfoscipio geothermicus DSM 3669]
MFIKASTFNKRIYLMIIALFMLVAGCSTRSLGVEQQAAFGPTLTDPGLSPNLDKVMDNIRSISSYKRKIGSQGEKDTAAYLQKELESYGYLPQVQAFPYDLQKEFTRNFRDFKDDSFWDVDVRETQKDGESQNIIAIKKPYNDASKNIIVISAHYDDTGYGAVIDNATGVAILLEVARLIANTNCNAEVRFVFFGGEQFGLNGSRYYVSKLSGEEKKNMIANINLDNLGIKGTNNLILATIDGKENQASALFKIFLQNNELQIVTAPASDYVSFARAGIPAVSLGQLPMPIKMEDKYSSMEEMDKALIQIEKSLLDENRLKAAFNMVIKALGQAIN